MCSAAGKADCCTTFATALHCSAHRIESAMALTVAGTGLSAVELCQLPCRAGCRLGLMGRSSRWTGGEP
jgi:hypothetical protein